MFPIRDTIRSLSFPVVNTIIIFINVVVFFIEMNYPGDVNHLILRYALIPARFSNPDIAAYFTTGQQAFTFFSFMFLHGGFLHLLGNMWFLYIFGDNVEDRLGHLRYLLFYFLCGWASALAHILTGIGSTTPTIGASGAVAGVMGAYMVLYPRARILTLILIIFIPYFIEIPAVFFLGIWFTIQFVSASFTDIHAAGIAWWAHIGGFAAGIVFAGILIWIPRTGLSDSMQQATARQTSPKLHVARAMEMEDEPNLYGSITITPKEAASGTRKLINLARGGQKKLFFVDVPPGIKNEGMIRLSGAGKKINDGTRGDVYINVKITGQDV